jgi:hypothetical protein
MNGSRLLYGLLIITAAIFLLPGCKKKDTSTNSTTTTNVSAASDNALAQNTYDDVKNWSDKAMAPKFKSPLNDTVYKGTCVLATLDLTAIPVKLTIDFGTTDCKCEDSIYRRGKMYVTFTGGYYDSLAVITYTFDNYFVNDNQVLGTKTITNNGRNSDHHYNWTTVVAGEIIKANSGGTIFWNSNTNLVWVSGDTTPFIWWDDVYQMTGTSSGTESSGLTYTCTITNPLSRKLNCEWIESGTMNIQEQGLPLIVLDFGTGTCDNQATATVNGTVYPITLP